MLLDVQIMWILTKKVNDNIVLDVYYLSEITTRTSNLKNIELVLTHKPSK